MRYRPEIDGLRAVAVVPVVLFHAGVAGVSGGFVGVDVFFVISGYLITSILLDDLNAGRFSIVRFYERRARRILPALFVVILCCLPFAWAWMLPQELLAFGKSVAATALFGSNVLAWREAGYFAAANELKPLLHTWSLVVEEQYYLFFPILLAVLWRWRRAVVVPALLVIVVASLALAVYGAQDRPVANFYLLPSRIWELLAGALVAASGGTVRERLRGWPADVLGIVGLAMIGAAVLFFDENTPTPGLPTLLPVLGVVLILAFARAGSGIGRALSLKPVVGIGLISYSLYLWHQPVLAFARIRNVASPEGPLLWALLIATLLLAWGTWRFVEQPFRDASPWLPRRWQIGTASFAGIAAAVGIGAALVGGGGFGERVAPSGVAFDDAADILAMLQPNYGLSRACDAEGFTLSPSCRTAEVPVLVLWGDSYAMHLAAALRSSASSVPFVQLALSGCGAFPSLAVRWSRAAWDTCLAFNDAALKWILAQDSVRVVVISSPFRQTEATLVTAEGRTFDTVGERRATLLRRVADLGSELAEAGKRLVIVSPPPSTGINLGLCAVRVHLNGVAGEVCDFALQEYQARNAPSLALVRTLEAVAPVVWLDRYLCKDERCHAAMDGIPLYRDAGHLSNEGSRRLGVGADLAGAVLAAASEMSGLPPARGKGEGAIPALISTGAAP